MTPEERARLRARVKKAPESASASASAKTARGKLIANSWPIGMATAVCRAMLLALTAKEAPNA
jgi:hypothetical protein